MDIKIYSTPTCPYCHLAKEYFSSKGVTYQDFDVSQDRQALEEMVKISGQMGVPIIVINNEVIVGFDRAKIDSLLAKS
ncbi:MAG TPA: glutaredoxin family protein [Candidatus Omnitrophica bacterium]|nr:MAG: NrdH-redoxin [Candidatus Omnitrophota bacterium]RKY43680.1 MAG: NrdH-redoxin [Candidatus Omnitrophota bacterium]HEC69396.1 glutaredoxin family protein [Candidatus Omnitrophota bacterium]